MNHKVGSFIAWCLIAAGTAGNAAQEPISARITSVEEGQRSLTVVPLKNSQKLPATLKLSIEPKAEMRGIRSLEDLESGDEIIFDGIPKNDREWTVRRIEATKRQRVDGTKPAEPGFFQNVKQQTRELWTDLRANIPVDRVLYNRYAEERLMRLEKRYNEIKQNFAVQQKEKMESRILQSREHLGFLKNASNLRVWQESKQDFDSSLASAQSALKEVSSQVLTEKKKYEWEIEDRIHEQRYDLEELNAAYQLSNTQHKRSAAAEAVNYGETIKELHKQLDFSDSRLDGIRKMDPVKWESQKAEMENQLYSIREAYLNLAEKIGPMKDPNTTIT